jgi:flagellar biosynthesis protein FlhG
MYMSDNDRFNIPPIVTVTSGKGGVGKSVISLGIAGILAKQGVRVLLMDADIGLGNLHILTNTTPVFTIEDFLSGNCALGDTLLEITPNLDLVPATSGMNQDDLNFSFEEDSLRVKLAGLKSSYDLILIDTSSGISNKTTGFSAVADETILIVTPELGSLADGYAVLKLISRKTRKKKNILVVNMAQSKFEGESTLKKFNEMTSQFLSLKMKHSIWLPFDPQIKSILLRQNLLSQKGGDLLLLQHIKSAVDQIFNSFPRIQFSELAENLGNVKSDFMLSSASKSSDRRSEIPHAGELEIKTVNPKSQVSRKDSL